jgi:hypothetical protein
MLGIASPKPPHAEEARNAPSRSTHNPAFALIRLAALATFSREREKETPRYLTSPAILDHLVKS